MLKVSRIFIATLNIGAKATPEDLLPEIRQSHHNPEDFSEGDLYDKYEEYTLVQVPLSRIDLDEWYLDEELTDKYVESLYTSEPPIPILYADYSIIDGNHRLNAMQRAGRVNAICWVGTKKATW
jgi:hypothetical protein